MGSVSDLQGFIKIVIPDELYDSISVKTLPVRPTMTCQQVGKYQYQPIILIQNTLPSYRQFDWSIHTGLLHPPFYKPTNTK